MLSRLAVSGMLVALACWVSMATEAACSPLLPKDNEAAKHVERLKHADPKQVIRAIKSLEAMGARASAAAPDLVRLMAVRSSERDGVSLAAALALMEIGDPAVGWLLTEMSTGDWISKVYARLALSSIVRRSDAALLEVVSNWVTRVTSGDPGDHELVRDAAAFCGAEGSKVIVGLLGQPSREVRAGAVSILGRCVEVDPSAIPALLKQLDRAPPALQFELVSALGAMQPRDPKVRGALFALLGDRHEQVRKAALFALGKTGPDALPILLANYENEELRKIVRSAVMLLGPEAMPGLINVLQDPSIEITLRSLCLGAITSMPESTEGVLEALQVALAAGEYELRRSAVSSAALRSLVPPVDLLPRLSGFMDDPEVAVRRAAALAIAEYGEDAVVCQEALLRRLRSDPDEGVRGATAYALGRLGSAAAVEPLREALHEVEGERPKEAIVIALGRIGAAAAPAAGDLLDVLEKRESTMLWYRQRVTAAFANIGMAALPVLHAWLDKHLDRRTSVSDVAASIAAIEEGRAQLWEKAKRASVDRRVEIAAALLQAGEVDDSFGPALAAGLSSEDPRIVREAAGGLGVLGKAARDHVERLLVVAEEPEYETRIAALKAIAAIAPKNRRVYNVLLDQLERNDSVRVNGPLVLALAGTGFATKQLDAILKEGVPYKVVAAGEALGLFDPPSKEVQALMVRELASSTALTRRYVITAIGGLRKPGEAVIEALRRAAFYDKSEQNRFDAQSALLNGGWFEAADLPYMVSAIESASFPVMVVLIRAIGSLGESAALAVPMLALQSITDNYDDRVIGAIAGGIGGEPYVDSRKLTYLGPTESYRDVRLAAIRALEAIGRPAAGALPELERNARDHDLEIAEAARAAVEKIARR